MRGWPGHASFVRAKSMLLQAIIAFLPAMTANCSTCNAAANGAGGRAGEASRHRGGSDGKARLEGCHPGGAGGGRQGAGAVEQHPPTAGEQEGHDGAVTVPRLPLPCWSWGCRPCCNCARDADRFALRLAGLDPCALSSTTRSPVFAAAGPPAVATRLGAAKSFCMANATNIFLLWQCPIHSGHALHQLSRQPAGAAASASRR